MSGATEDAEVNVGGLWKDVNCIWTNIGGTWKRAWTNYDVNLDGGAFSSGIHARTYINSDGTVDAWTQESGYVQLDSATDWIIPNASAGSEADFEAKWVLTAGSTPDETTAGWTSNTYADLTSNLYVGRSESPGITTCDVTITIRRKSDSVVLASGLYEMTIF
jgi:hypothetical protein